jgi:hypothetical protein
MEIVCQPEGFVRWLSIDNIFSIGLPSVMSRVIRPERTKRPDLTDETVRKVGVRRLVETGVVSSAQLLRSLSQPRATCSPHRVWRQVVADLADGAPVPHLSALATRLLLRERTTAPADIASASSQGAGHDQTKGIRDMS